MKKILFIFGTRPEAIKMAPVIQTAQKNSSKLKTVICITGQHRALLDQVLDVFHIAPNYDLNVMKKNQSLFQATSRILITLEKILKKESPDMVVVQGDTTTAFIASLAAFYLRIKIAHIEAGLRSFNKFHPFPEEINRKCVDVFADLYFAPTKGAKDNLINEGITENRISVTGNTIVDAINIISPMIKRIKLAAIVRNMDLSRKLILVTAHRRENFNEGISNICCALKELEYNNPDIEVVLPVHPNPNVRNKVKMLISGANSRIHVIPAVDYFTFLKLLSCSYLVLSDSGGVQEEAPSFNKRILILREVTERPEIIECGLGKLVGTDKDTIINETQKIILSGHNADTRIKNPFGDGMASKRIIKEIINS